MSNPTRIGLPYCFISSIIAETRSLFKATPCEARGGLTKFLCYTVHIMLNSIKQNLLIFCIALSVLLFVPSVHAAKPRMQKSTPTVSKKIVAGISYSSAKLSTASRSVVVSFLNLDKVSKISYLLNYTGSGQSQGVGGAITPGGTTDSRDLYFGTCSKGVCTPHYSIKNATLTVTATLKSGGSRTKRYVLRPKW